MRVGAVETAHAAIRLRPDNQVERRQGRAWIAAVFALSDEIISLSTDPQGEERKKPRALAAAIIDAKSTIANQAGRFCLDGRLHSRPPFTGARTKPSPVPRERRASWGRPHHGLNCRQLRRSNRQGPRGWGQKYEGRKKSRSVSSKTSFWPRLMTNASLRTESQSLSAYNAQL